MANRSYIATKGMGGALSARAKILGGNRRKPIGKLLFQVNVEFPYYKISRSNENTIEVLFSEGGGKAHRKKKSSFQEIWIHLLGGGGEKSIKGGGNRDLGIARGNRKRKKAREKGGIRSGRRPLRRGLPMLAGARRETE